MQTTTNDTTTETTETTETRASLDELLLERKIALQSEREADDHELRENCQERARAFSDFLIRRLGEELAAALRLEWITPTSGADYPRATFTHDGRTFELWRDGYNTRRGDALTLTDAGSRQYKAFVHTPADLLDALNDFPRWRERQEQRAAKAREPKPKHQFLANALATGLLMKVITTARDSDNDTICYTGVLDSQSDHWLLISMSDGTGQRIIRCSNILAIVPEPPKHEAGYDERDELPF